MIFAVGGHYAMAIVYGRSRYGRKGDRDVKSQQIQTWQTTALLVIVGIVALLGLNAFVIINPGEAGVISILGKARDGELLEGIHIKPPLVSKVDIYNLRHNILQAALRSSNIHNLGGIEAKVNRKASG